MSVDEGNRCYLCGNVTYTSAINADTFVEEPPGSGIVIQQFKNIVVCHHCMQFYLLNRGMVEWIVRVLLNAERRAVVAAGREAVRRLMEVPDTRVDVGG